MAGRQRGWRREGGTRRISGGWGLCSGAPCEEGGTGATGRTWGRWVLLHRQAQRGGRWLGKMGAPSPRIPAERSWASACASAFLSDPGHPHAGGPGRSAFRSHGPTRDPRSLTWRSTSGTAVCIRREPRSSAGREISWFMGGGASRLGLGGLRVWKREEITPEVGGVRCQRRLVGIKITQGAVGTAGNVPGVLASPLRLGRTTPPEMHLDSDVTWRRRSLTTQTLPW